MAWQRLVHLYGPLVLSWCRRAGLAEHDAQDVCQETFGAVAIALPKFRRDRHGDTFRGWLRTIVRNKLTDFHRRLSRNPDAVGGAQELGDIADVSVPTDTALDPVDREDASGEDASGEEASLSNEASICRRALEFIREDFEKRTWTAFWRTAIDDQTAPEVAEELGMSPAAVRKAKSRVLGRLRTELAELVDFE